MLHYTTSMPNSKRPCDSTLEKYQLLACSKNCTISYQSLPIISFGYQWKYVRVWPYLRGYIALCVIKMDIWYQLAHCRGDTDFQRCCHTMIRTMTHSAEFAPHRLMQTANGRRDVRCFSVTISMTATHQSSCIFSWDSFRWWSSLPFSLAIYLVSLRDRMASLSHIATWVVKEVPCLSCTICRSTKHPA